MTTVYTNRVLFGTDEKHDFIFLNDNGGMANFEILPGVSVRVVRQDRFNHYLTYLLSHAVYDEVRVTSLPLAVPILAKSNVAKIVYEFHSSSLDVLAREIGDIDFSLVTEVWTPSKYLKEIVDSMLPAICAGGANVIKNLVNVENFNSKGPVASLDNLPTDRIPLVWVGRLDKGKNFKDFVRILSCLPEEYIAIVILSLENDPARMAEALYETDCHSLRSRVKFLLNVSQSDMSAIYRAVNKRKGVFCSTSLAESFGYCVVEAVLTGLPVVAYDVGALPEHLEIPFAIKMVDVGDVDAFVNELKCLDHSSMIIENAKARDAYLTPIVT
jgi:glycosyltransferase involved in cell wall biosynthesis